MATEWIRQQRSVCSQGSSIAEKQARGPGKKRRRRLERNVAVRSRFAVVPFVCTALPELLRCKPHHFAALWLLDNCPQLPPWRHTSARYCNIRATNRHTKKALGGHKPPQRTDPSQGSKLISTSPSTLRHTQTQTYLSLHLVTESLSAKRQQVRGMVCKGTAAVLISCACTR